jgi:hypothetical protein
MTVLHYFENGDNILSKFVKYIKIHTIFDFKSYIIGKILIIKIYYQSPDKSTLHNFISKKILYDVK